MMANEDENDTENLNARIRDLEKQLGESEARAAAEKEIERARNRLASEQREAAEKKAAEAESRLGELRSRLTESAAAAAELAEVKKELNNAEEQLKKAKGSLEELGEFEERAKAELEARTELREFVASSLADIMRGVDEAALSAVSRHLQSGLLEEPMISPSRVGQGVAGAETLVHFDLAVVASSQKVEGEGGEQSGGVGISVRGKLWEQIGFTGTAGFRIRRESFGEERHGVTHDQRIRFSVPLVFASQDNLMG